MQDDDLQTKELAQDEVSMGVQTKRPLASYQGVVLSFAGAEMCESARKWKPPVTSVNVLTL